MQIRRSIFIYSNERKTSVKVRVIYTSVRIDDGVEIFEKKNR